mgnify:FL=1
MKYEVDESFITEAYDAACDDWKKKLEEKFPDLLNCKNRIENLPEYKEYMKKSFGEKSLIYIDNYILIELPKSNTAWSIAAFALATSICKKGIAGIVHADYKESFISTYNVCFFFFFFKSRYEVDFLLLKRYH